MKRRTVVVCVLGLLVSAILMVLPLFLLPQDSFLVKTVLGDAKKAKRIRKSLARFQNMTPEQAGYRAFHHNLGLFYRPGEGKDDQRERLRNIRHRIESDPLAPMLNAQLANYYNWRKTIPQPQEQARINAAKTIEERLEVIREIKENQDRMQQLQDYLGSPPWHDPLPGFEFAENGADDDGDVYPTSAELAGFLESLDQQQLQILLGREPKTFVYELQRAYRKAREYNREQRH